MGPREGRIGVRQSGIVAGQFRHHARLLNYRIAAEIQSVGIGVLNEKKRLEAVMETLLVGVAILDTQGGNIQSNRMYEQIWGSSRPESRTISDYAKYKAYWVDSGRPVQPDEWASARAVQKGETVWVTSTMVTAQPLILPEASKIGAALFITNACLPSKRSICISWPTTIRPQTIVTIV